MEICIRKYIYCILLYCTVLYFTVLYCIVLFITVLFCAILYCIVLLLYSMILLRYRKIRIVSWNISFKTVGWLFLFIFLRCTNDTNTINSGNILVSIQPDGTPKLNFLDCGLVVEVGPHQHVNMIKILGALTRKDGRLAGQLMVDTSSGSQASEYDVEMFIQKIVNICSMDDDNVSMFRTIQCSCCCVCLSCDIKYLSHFSVLCTLRRILLNAWETISPISVFRHVVTGSNWKPPLSTPPWPWRSWKE